MKPQQPESRMEDRDVPDTGAEKKGKLSLVLALATLVSAFGSSFQYGYNVAAINSPSQFMQSFYNATYFERYDSYIDDSYLTLLWSISVSMYPLGGFFGSLMVAPLVNKLGRKGTLLFNNIFSIVPAILMGASEAAKSFEMVIVARVIIGVCAGLSSNVVPMYLGEMSPKNLRGAIGVVPQLFITIGILVAQILGLRSILGNAEGWPIMLALTGIPAVIELLVLPFFPESPRYTLIQKGDTDKARRDLQKLRNREDVDEEIEEMHVEDQSEKAEGRLSVLTLFSFRSLRWQLISVFIMNMGQQLSGVNAIYYYADSIYLSAGVEESNVQYVTIATGSINVIMTLIAETATWIPYLSAACLIIYVIGHAIGPSPIPYVVTTEMFRQSSRPAAFMVAGSVHWLSNFTVGLIFPFLEKGLGPFSFIVFAAICLATLLYILMIVPETKNKTFLEVSQLFATRNKTRIIVEMESTSAKVTSDGPDGNNVLPMTTL
ncbi:GTR5 protein, partial [Polypterus senegalus]|nr:GTR5 protein [Polypterus senegalus]